MSYVEKLVCRWCGKEYKFEDGPLTCATEGCLGRLEVHYDYEKIGGKLTRQVVESRRERGFIRYIELMPLESDAPIVTLYEGGTPLIHAKKLGEKIGLRNLYLKDESRNPTGSFKDRPISVGANRGLQLGYKVTVTASSGNAAASLAAHSARMGMACVAFVPEHVSPGKAAQLQQYGARVIRVSGLEKGEDPTVKMMKITYEKYQWYPCPSFGPFNPYQSEGTKTMAYETAEQLGWRVPDWVFLQVGGGGLLLGNWKGYLELECLGFTDKLPRIVAVQSTGCMPVVRAYKEKMHPHRIKPWERPDTVASGIEDPYPWDGDSVLEALEKSNGTAVEVTDEEIIETCKALAKTEGIFTTPTGGAGLAGIVKLFREGYIDRDEVVFTAITETGLKEPEIFYKEVGMPPLIEPRMEMLEDIISKGNFFTNKM